jgi:pseudouridine synthase
MSEEENVEDNTIRLQKYLSQRGVASRRKAADIIERGKVQVNGEIVREPGYRVSPENDSVIVYDKALRVNEETKRTIAIYKPRGYICSVSNAQGKSVLNLLKGVKERVVPAGRLDKDSEGLLFLSNDGDLINKLIHPSFGHKKVYEVSVEGQVNKQIISELKQSITIDGKKTRRCIVERLEDESEEVRVLRFELEEGRNRQVRALCERSELEVLTLKRVQINDIKLADLNLQPGQWIDVSIDSLKMNK